jgi:flavin-dependent dehydrogenase
MEIFGSYDVLVAGAGVSGVVAAIRSAREGARTLLVESGPFLGGLVTAGRLTKPSGLINGGIFAELLERCARWGAADSSIRHSSWGAYTGSFDSEAMSRAILELIDEAGVQVLLRAQVVDAIMQAETLCGAVVQTKSGRKIVLAKVSIDATGDGDLAALASAEFAIGRSEDGLTQPISSYMRVINIDIPSLVRDCQEHPEDVRDLVLPDGPSTRNEDYAMIFLATGFAQRIHRARDEGFPWIIPREDLTLKAGFIPGELNVNVTRVQADGLDDRALSRAEIEIRKQAYCAFDFLKQYLRGFDEDLWQARRRSAARDHLSRRRFQSPAAPPCFGETVCGSLFVQPHRSNRWISLTPQASTKQQRK